MDMKTFALALTAATLALSSAAFAQTRVYDPAAESNDPRFIYQSAETASPAVTGSSAIATNDSSMQQPKTWFGPNLDRAVESKNSPYDN
jgi:hypothetical protein